MNSSSPLHCVRVHGIDLVDIDAFQRTLDLSDREALERYFTVDELRDAGSATTRTARLAGRFAVKEAVLKALGLGWGDGVSFTDVETVNEESGAPLIVLYRGVASLAEKRGIVSWLVSTTHTDKVAMASVIGLATQAS